MGRGERVILDQQERAKLQSKTLLLTCKWPQSVRLQRGFQVELIAAQTALDILAQAVRLNLLTYHCT